MAKERRQTNKQSSIESLDKKLDDAITERLKLADAVEEIHEKVNFDGGLVYQCDLKELREETNARFDKNDGVHEDIIVGTGKRFDSIDSRFDDIDAKLELIYPVIEKQIEESKALDIVINKYLGKTKSVKFWVQFLLMVGVVVVGAGYAFAWVKTFFKGLI
jgi:tetrahydromethanopterin S-methyltransferase subunit G